MMLNPPPTCTAEDSASMSPPRSGSACTHISRSTIASPANSRRLTGWLIWAGSSGLAHLGWLIRAGSSGLVHVGWLIWAGSSGLAHLGWLIWAGSSGLAHLGWLIMLLGDVAASD